MLAADEEFWRLRMRSEVVHESGTAFMSGDAEVLGVSIFLQRFFRHISVDYVLLYSKLMHFLIKNIFTVDSRHHRRERRLITDSKRRIATIRFLSFSFAGAVSANTGLVFI